MRSIEKRFKHREEKNPCWSSWVCFADAIMGQNFNRKILREHFNNLVDKNDYEKKDKMQLLKYLYLLTEDSS